MTIKKHLIGLKSDKKVSRVRKFGSIKTVNEIMNSNFAKKQITKARGRKISSTSWLFRHINDPFVKAAKTDGFVSRAAYKLIEKADKYNIFSNVSSVLDVGAAPGSWMQVAWSVLCNKKDALLVGIDISEIALAEKFLMPMSRKPVFIHGDFTLLETQSKIAEYIDKFDLIISDMAPNATGSNSTDHLVIIKLVNSVIDFAERSMNIGGNLVLKLWHGAEENDIIMRLKSCFKKVMLFKPKASRSGSSEIYVISLNFF